MSDGYYDTSYPPSILRTGWSLAPPAIAGLKVTLAVPSDVTADSYELNWGDGSPVDYWGSTTGAATHTYGAAGTYDIVVDPYGAQYAPHTETVTVTAPAEPEPEPEP